MCPMCGKVNVNATKKILKGVQFAFVHCPHCKIGELLPLLPPWKLKDAYDWFFDYYNEGIIPKFKVKDLETFLIVREHTSVGEVIYVGPKIPKRN